MDNPRLERVLERAKQFAPDLADQLTVEANGWTYDQARYDRDKSYYENNPEFTQPALGSWAQFHYIHHPAVSPTPVSYSENAYTDPTDADIKKALKNLRQKLKVKAQGPMPKEDYSIPVALEVLDNYLATWKDQVETYQGPEGETCTWNYTAPKKEAFKVALEKFRHVLYLQTTPLGVSKETIEEALETIRDVQHKLGNYSMGGPRQRTVYLGWRALFRALKDPRFTDSSALEPSLSDGQGPDDLAPSIHKEN